MREKIVRLSLFLLIVVQRRCIGNEASFQLVLSYSGWPSSVQATSMLPDMGERAFRASTALPLFLSLPLSLSLSLFLCLSLSVSLGHPRRHARTSAHLPDQDEDGASFGIPEHLCALCPRPTRDFSPLELGLVFQELFRRLSNCFRRV